MVPKWVQNEPGHSQNTNCENVKKPLVFPLQMACRPAQNVPKLVPKGPFRSNGRPSGRSEGTNGRSGGRSGQVRWQVRAQGRVIASGQDQKWQVR